MDISFELVGISEAVAKLRALGPIADRGCELAVIAAGEVIRDVAVEYVSGGGSSTNGAPLKRVSGTLARSLHVELVEGRSPNNPAVDIGTDLVYAAIHEFGGIIEPVNAPRLVWQNEDGQWFSADRVEIPARPYLRPAVDESGPEAMRVAGAVLGRILERAAR